MTVSRLVRLALNMIQNWTGRTVTGQVFCAVEENFISEYDDLVREYGKASVNRSIGREVKMELNLKNAPDREDKPMSSLIKSHQRFY